MEADPIGQAGGVNVYAYALNNPAVLSDPKGLQVVLRPTDKKGDPTEGGIIENALDYELYVFGRYMNSIDNPYAGGYRHCVAACLAKRRYWFMGEILVAGWDYVQENESSDSYGDRDAEQCGLTAADGPDPCRDACLGFFPIPPLSHNPR